MTWNIVTKPIVSLSALLMLTPVASAQTPTTDTSRGFAIRYADGRISTRPLRPKGGMMTAVFPRINGMETARDGMLLNGLDVSHVVEGDEVVVTVSLLYRNGPNRSKVKVATVRVSADHPVEVDELRGYGVEPLSLSLVSIPATYAFPPHAVSVSAYVDVWATPIGPNAAAYRVTIANRSPFPLIWFRFEAYRNSGSPISGMPRGKRNFPIVMPNAEHTFELSSGTMGQSSGDDPGAWQPVDRIELTSLMWQDGAVEGNKETAAQYAGFERQRSDYLRSVLRILRESDQSVGGLPAALFRVQPPDVELEEVRKGFIEQLERFHRQQLSSEGLDFRTWRRQTIADLEQWVARIVFPKS